ncbi:hypothetical protein ZWY2020_033308 [Hordeum vulgare]|nr:hypothetical protein ZWY2020_033308 [Hordeum vulgare]
MEPERKPLSLLELCFRSAVDNLRYMNSVDNLEMGLLKRILPHCTLEQLTHIESCTQMDLTGVTDVLWKRFFQREFGEADMNVAIKRMKESGVRYKWKKLFEAKTEKQKQIEQRMSAGLRNKYEETNMKQQTLVDSTRLACTDMTSNSKDRKASSSTSSSASSPLQSLVHLLANLEAALASGEGKSRCPSRRNRLERDLGCPRSLLSCQVHRPSSTTCVTSRKTKWELPRRPWCRSS